MFLPEGGLAVSIASTVWVGVLIVCILNLRLGWSLSGFVIPGFLAPLFISRPMAGFINIFEGILAYFLAKKVSETGFNLKKWDNFFGRDRFFAIVLASVLVKIIFDGYIFEVLAEFLQLHFNYQIDYHISLNSYGLIVGALIANQLWEEGFKKEIVPLMVTTLLTYLVVRYGFMEISNFRMSQINSLYANIDDIFPASSKVYIILMITTLIASHMGLKYGWDYGGIITAGLLALQWYSPLRVAMTLVEASVIYIICSSLLKIQFLESWNVIRARKILLFFNVGFLYKIILGDVVMAYFPEERVLEFYGFGYMLSTLLAIKMYDNTNSLRIIFMILHTSLVGFLGGSVITLLLIFVTDHHKTGAYFSQQKLISQNKEIEYTKGHLIGYIQSYKNASMDSAGQPLIMPTGREILTLDVKVVEPLVQLIHKAKTLGQDSFKAELNKINGYANNFGYQITLFDDLTFNQQLVIFAPSPGSDKSKNWGTYIFRPFGDNDHLIEVPRPFDEVNSLNFSLHLFQKIGAQFLLIGGSASNVNKDRSADLTRPQSKRSLYNLVSQVLLRDHVYNRPILQIRGYSIGIDSISKPSTDVLIAFSDGAQRKGQLKPMQEEVIKLIEEQSLTYSLVASDEETTGYEVGELFLAKYLLQTPNKDLAVIWLSPALRSDFRNPDNNFLALSYYNTLNIPTKRDALTNFLATNSPLAGWQPEQNLRDMIELYIDTRDIVVLKNIQDLKSYTLSYVSLDDDGRAYIAISNLQNKLLALVSMSNQADSKNDFVISPTQDQGIKLSSKRWILFKKES